jgi:hypothetical protein
VQILKRENSNERKTQAGAHKEILDINKYSHSAPMGKVVIVEGKFHPRRKLKAKNVFQKFVHVHRQPHWAADGHITSIL